MSNEEKKNPLDHVLSNLGTNITNFLRIPIPNPNSCSSTPALSVARNVDQFDNTKIDSSSKNLLLIKQQLKNVPVYRMKSGHDQVPFLKSDIVGDRKANFFFFSKADAHDYATVQNTVKANECLGNIQLTKVPLAEIIELEEAGFHKEMPSICTWFIEDVLPSVAPDKFTGYVRDAVTDRHMYIRLVPDMSEVKNALKERKKAGFHSDNFSGVPVFQSDALNTKVDGSSSNLRPAFFTKADLEKALRDKKRDTDSEIIQVTALEVIIQEMKDCTISKWNDVVLVPPGGKIPRNNH
ncbi:hypothetical protein ACP275_14G309600 [Erythranthe tilingii]